MEEDINFIRKYMQDYYSEDISIEDDFKFEKAIENLLKRYKELEEENKRLNENNMNMQKELFVNNIPISVIQNKIDFYKKNFNMVGATSKINVLQELLDLRSDT